MARLIKADIAFLERHGIPLALTFDAVGLTRSEYGPLMKFQGKFAAYGVTRCQKEGHALRNRHGTCLRCFPATIAYIRRANSPGYVYIAQSKKRRLLKVGYSRDQVDNRLYIANCEAHGGASDWEKRLVSKSKIAGRIEIEVHKSLKEYSVSRAWVRNGKEVEPREIYCCDYEHAKAALESVVTGPERKQIQEY